jgi:hypothetical protein
VGGYLKWMFIRQGRAKMVMQNRRQRKASYLKPGFWQSRIDCKARKGQYTRCVASFATAFRVSPSHRSRAVDVLFLKDRMAENICK